MNAKNIIFRSFFVLVLLLSTTLIFAQPGGGSGGGSGSGGPPPGTGAPIDGGASIFLAGVAAYAHRMLKANAQKRMKEK